MTRTLIAIAALAAALALPATAGAASSSHKTLVSTHVTGGYAGLDTLTTIRRDGSGSVTTRRGRTMPSLDVPDKQMARLRKRLKQADFPSLRNYPVPPGSADFIETRITYGAKTVDASYRIPKRLQRVLDAVDAAVNAGSSLVSSR